MWNDELSQEEQNQQYLQANPALEMSLWREWVEVVCGWDKIPTPTTREWESLVSNFYHGKAPIDSVVELKKMRAYQSNGQ